MDRADADVFNPAPAAALSVTIALTVMNMTLIVPVLPDFADHFGVSLAAAAAMVSVFAGGRLVFRFWGGIGADRFGARRVSVIATVVVGACAAWAALLDSFWPVLGVRLVQGMAVGMIGVATNQYLLRTTPRQHLGRATAVFQTGIVAGASVGPLAGGVLADLGGLWAPFWAQAVLSLALVPVILLVMSAGETEVRTVRSSLHMAGALLRRPVFLGVMLLGFTLFFLRAGAANALLPAYGDEVAGLSPTAIGFVVSAATFTSVLAMIPAGRLVDRVGRKPVMLTGVVAVTATVALYGTVSSFWGLIGVSCLTGLTVGLASVPPPTMIGDLAPPGSEGIAAGVFRMSSDLGWIVGPLALGAMADAGRWGLGFVVAGVPLLAAGALFLAAPETGERASARGG
ncbi:MAG: MFS transporter [Actinobacteria bacterium]|nr:MFS transporter [Actinomycetota bacterium]